MSASKYSAYDGVVYLRNLVLNAPSRWTRGAMARKGKGALSASSTTVNSGKVVEVTETKTEAEDNCFCLMGGIDRTIYDFGLKPFEGEGIALRQGMAALIAEAATGKKPTLSAADGVVMTYNDDSRRTFAEIAESLKKATVIAASV